MPDQPYRSTSLAATPAATPHESAEAVGLWDADTAAAYLGVTRRWLYDNHRSMRVVRIGGHIRFRRIDLDAFVASRVREPITPAALRFPQPPARRSSAKVRH